jgi:hypothetical protein
MNLLHNSVGRDIAVYKSRSLNPRFMTYSQLLATRLILEKEEKSLYAMKITMLQNYYFSKVE